MSTELKRGYYKASILEWNLGVSKTKQTPEFSITFELLRYKGPGGRLEDCPTLKRTLFKYITEGTIEYFARDLAALGYDRDTFDDLDPQSPNPFDFSGIEIEVQLKYEKYEGKDREKWELAMVSGGAIERTPIEASGLAMLNAQFGSKLAGGRNGAAPSPARVPPPRTPATSNEGEEIPF